ncbi:MAG: F-type H+-transporting ATPase subunit gamma [Microgenomates group bacterium Gr01-1014_80]|nr:MAG: F-type H+-transporting ATPase subunit gamma [Microgenomates group bacterium Gr01-1014_80]
MTIKEINGSIEEGAALKNIAAAYTEISSLKLKRIREQVLRTRAFFVEVLNIYAMLKHIVLKKTLIEPPKGKKVSIILTSNNRFYGHIESELLRFFLSQRSDKGDILVVGTGGREAFGSLHLPFQSVIFKDDVPAAQELTNLVNMIKAYGTVLVYFARFKSVLTQVPAAVDITQSQAQAAKTPERTEESFIFEPEAPKILDFFDSQLKQTLIEQTFLETELARTSSRLIFMDQAQNNADEFLKQQQRLLSSARMSLQNTQILETITSMIKERHL